MFLLKTVYIDVASQYAYSSCDNVSQPLTPLKSLLTRAVCPCVVVWMCISISKFHSHSILNLTRSSQLINGFTINVVIEQVSISTNSRLFTLWCPLLYRVHSATELDFWEWNVSTCHEHWKKTDISGLLRHLSGNLFFLSTCNCKPSNCVSTLKECLALVNS